jgi:putative DNA primase/helicase
VLLEYWDALRDVRPPEDCARALRAWAADDSPDVFDPKTSIPIEVMPLWQNGDAGLARMMPIVAGGDVLSHGDQWFTFVSESRLWVRRPQVAFLTVAEAVNRCLENIRVYLKHRLAHARDPLVASDIDQLLTELQRVAHHVRSASVVSMILRTFAMPLFNDDDILTRLDSTPHLLGVRNGVVDLRTGELRERRRDDYIERALHLVYQQDAPADEIDAIMGRMFDGVEGMVPWFQKLLGYGITGETCEEVFVMFVSPGRSGKGVVTQTLQALLGDYYKEIHPGVIARRRVSNIDEERYKLLGSRIALINELAPEDVLLTAEVQRISGGDGIPARRVYGSATTITPHHLAILSTNHVPEMYPMLASMTNRLLVVRFPVEFTDLGPGERETVTRKQRDPDLKRRLQTRLLPSVLTWLVRGAVRWYAEGLRRDTPRSVCEAMREVTEVNDKLTHFLETWCVVGGPGQYTPTMTLHAAYKTYRGSHVNIHTFVSELKAKGFEFCRKRTPNGVLRSVKGIALRDV